MTHLRADKLDHLLQHAYAHAPAVKMIFDRAGLTPDDVRSLTDLDRIPVTSKDRLVELQAADPPFGGFLAVPLEHAPARVLFAWPALRTLGREQRRDGHRSGDVCHRRLDRRRRRDQHLWLPL